MNQPASYSQYFSEGSAPVPKVGRYLGRRGRRSIQSGLDGYYTQSAMSDADRDMGRSAQPKSLQGQIGDRHQFEKLSLPQEASLLKTEDGLGLQSHLRSAQSGSSTRDQPGSAILDQQVVRAARAQSEVQVPRYRGHTQESDQLDDFEQVSEFASMSQVLPGPISAMEESARKLLDLQADWVNQLSGELEAALLRLKVLSYQCNARKGRRSPALREVYKSGMPSVPWVERLEGDYILRPHAVDLQQAEQFLVKPSAQAGDWEESAEPAADAPANPAQPRPLLLTKPAYPQAELSMTAGSHSKVERVAKQSGNRLVTAEFPDEVDQHRSESSTQPGLGRSRSHLAWMIWLLRPPVQFPQALRDAAIWVLMATALRIGMQVLQSSFPQLWGFAIAGMVLAALLMVYQVAFVARAFGIAGYRVVLVAVGLVLGGRL